MKVLIALVAGFIALTDGAKVSAQHSTGLGTALSQNDEAPSIGKSLQEELLQDVFKNVLNRAYPEIGSRWTIREVAVCWEDFGDSIKEDRDLVQRAATESWQAHSGLGFTGWAECSDQGQRGIRISVSDIGPHVKGLGTRIDGIEGGMVLNFTFENWSPICKESNTIRTMCIYSIAVHEFGHALGFAHEQNRPDTPGDCARLPRGSSGDTLLTPWDPSSVMNYCNPVYNNSGVLSALDIFAVQQLYPF